MIGFRCCYLRVLLLVWAAVLRCCFTVGCLVMVLFILVFEFVVVLRLCLVWVGFSAGFVAYLLLGRLPVAFVVWLVSCFWLLV